MLISTLLYANDAVIFADDEKSIKKGLDMLKVVSRSEKCRVMHTRRKGVERTED